MSGVRAWIWVVSVQWVIAFAAAGIGIQLWWYAKTKRHAMIGASDVEWYLYHQTVRTRAGLSIVASLQAVNAALNWDASWMRYGGHSAVILITELVVLWLVLIVRRERSDLIRLFEQRRNGSS